MDVFANAAARVQSWAADAFDPIGAEVDLSAMREHFRKLGKRAHFAKSVIIKTWYQAWTTSYRAHDDLKRQCVFGCLCRDDQLHYCQCPLYGPSWRRR